MFDGICEAIHREIESLDSKFMGGKASMSAQELDSIDKMAHTLKSITTYAAMRGEERRVYPRYRDEYSDYRRY